MKEQNNDSCVILICLVRLHPTGFRKKKEATFGNIDDAVTRNNGRIRFKGKISSWVVQPDGKLDKPQSVGSKEKYFHAPVLS